MHWEVTIEYNVPYKCSYSLLFYCIEKNICCILRVYYISLQEEMHGLSVGDGVCMLWKTINYYGHKNKKREMKVRAAPSSSPDFFSKLAQ